MPRVTLNTLTSYKVNKNLTVEAREENGKNTLFVNGKVYVFDKIEEGNFFFSKEEKNINPNIVWKSFLVVFCLLVIISFGYG